MANPWCVGSVIAAGTAWPTLHGIHAMHMTPHDPSRLAHLQLHAAKPGAAALPSTAPAMCARSRCTGQAKGRHRTMRPTCFDKNQAIVPMIA